MDTEEDCVCTLFEGDYHFGVGALVNSLCRAGFRGTVFAGYKGPLPSWAQTDAFNRFEPAPGVVIEFIRLETSWHLANYKAKFMFDLLENHAKSAQRIAYFDPDIVVTCRWGFFQDWMDGGVSVVQEITNGTMPSSHPLRRAWTAFLNTNGEVKRNDMDRYFNSGFVALARNRSGFLLLWQKLMECILAEQEGIATEFMPGDRSLPFYGVDQDCMNAALMATSEDISAIGPEGMGFVSGGFTMQHAVGSPKPWRFSFLQSMMSGKPPTSAIKAFWEHADGPIRLMSDQKLILHRVGVRLAALSGRFHSRN